MSQGPTLRDFGILGHDWQVVLPAIAVTPEIESLLLHQGIDPTAVNRLHLPAGYGSVGTFTFLTAMMNDEFGTAFQEAIGHRWGQRVAGARVGAASVPLSLNYRVRRLAPMPGDPSRTLAVVVWDDWRHYLNRKNSYGILPSGAGTESIHWNAYSSDWKLPYQEPLMGTTPAEALRDTAAGFELFDSTTGEPKYDAVPEPLWQELNNPLNLREDGMRLSSASNEGQFIDRVLTNCGIVALPQVLLPRWSRVGDAEASDTYELPGLPENYENPGNWVFEYIGWGYKRACINWNMLRRFYSGGSVSVTYASLKDERGDWELGDVSGEHEGALLADVTECDKDAGGGILSGWTGHTHDTATACPVRVMVAFPMKHYPTGTTVGSVVVPSTHGRPQSPESNYLPDADYSVTVTAVVRGVTDHLKTRWNQGFATPELTPDDDLIQLEEDWGIDRDDPNNPPGPPPPNGNGDPLVGPYGGMGGGGIGGDDDEETANAPSLRQIAMRAHELSRRYYARYFAGVGDVRWHGHQYISAWAGAMNQEWGYANGAPYTRVWGELDAKLYGFSIPSFADEMVLPTNMLALTRPDGGVLLEVLASGGGAGTGLIGEIVRVHSDYDPDPLANTMGRANYDVLWYSDGNEYPALTPHREIENVWYKPAKVGDLCVFYMTEGEVGGEVNKDYVLYVAEEVQTASCKQIVGGDPGEPLRSGDPVQRANRIASLHY